MKLFKHLAIVATLVFFGATAAFAGGESRPTFLSTAELKELIPGATVVGKENDGGRMEVTYKADGSYSGHIDRGQRIWIKGRWTILSSDNGGVFCQKEWCWKFVQKGDNSYDRYSIYEEPVGGEPWVLTKPGA